MFGLTMDKLVVIGVIAAFVIGPQRLPRAAAALAQLTRRVRDYTGTARERLSDELGPEFREIEWEKLDPRQYDPRRIIQDALRDDSHTDKTPDPSRRS
ncbi:Sec-independent protein translocase TatB [Leifsonia shinshuensis]|uniref:Sec-independent protein translocase TatB n=1 Tax=Leifsonia shinshuensis TaxID=150026 RepID=UPI002860A06E|nr:Sec-independent protein translocase TatB [Leifsonia shinshuensis]MDR6972698.1 sec-independent protein translocase protein TatB [Leifsonia shinshuensis]